MLNHRNSRLLLVLAVFACLASCKNRGSQSGVLDASQCPSAPTGSNCNYYQCLEQKYKCGTAGYPRSYGEKYCKKFQGSCEGKLNSQAALEWIRGTTKCLQSDLESSLPTLNTCDSISDHAFNSHSYCYTKGAVDHGGKSFCSLGPSNWQKIYTCIDGNDRFGTEILRQMRRTATSCIGFFGSSFFLQDEPVDESLLDHESQAVIDSLPPNERERWAEELKLFIAELDRSLGSQ